MKTRLVFCFGVLVIFCLNASYTFAQDSASILGQVWNDYKDNPRRGDANWKNKQIEVTGEIVNFLPDGSVYVIQRIVVSREEFTSGDWGGTTVGTRIVSAMCFFKASEDKKLLNYNRGSTIKLKGIGNGVKDLPTDKGGTAMTIYFKDCVVVGR